MILKNGRIYVKKETSEGFQKNYRNKLSLRLLSLIKS